MSNGKMTGMHIVGFLCSILIGLSLGLMGGGGSMLTIPVLVYLLGVNPLVSTSYSLFVVGTTSLVGAVNYVRKRQVNYRAALLFAIPSFVAIFFTRRYLIPIIPDPLFNHTPYQINKTLAFMLFFAGVMLIASLSMIFRRNRLQADKPVRFYYYPYTALVGLLAGVLTGLVGVGGGFLIIPALVLLGGLPMKRAVGTSLVIISANSFIGFISDSKAIAINWSFLLSFTAFAVVGILIGSYVSQFMIDYRLRKLFGWIIFGLSIYIIGKEAFTHLIT
ncbi:sulfite exporter TauE/SafE family protein [Spirosoma gilvum]